MNNNLTIFTNNNKEIYKDFLCGENNRNIKEKNNIFAEFLYGSQNYGLETEKSDVDTKVIVLPSLRDLVDRNITSKTTTISHGLADIKDIKTMFDQLYKSNPSYLEILASDYVIYDAPFRRYLEMLRNNAELISLRDKKRLVHATYGTIMNKMSALMSKLGTNKEAIRKYGYDGKNASHVLRLEEFIERILSGEKLKDALNAKRYDNFEAILNIKEQKLDFESVQHVCRDSARNVFKLCKKDFEKPNDSAEELLETISYELIRENIRRSAEMGL